jgi:hypothetical protein
LSLWVAQHLKVAPPAAATATAEEKDRPAA